MKLKKINSILQDNLVRQNITEPTAMQKATFGIIKSGVDVVVLAPKEEGKTTAMVIAALQRIDQVIETDIATKILIVAKNRQQVDLLVESFKVLGMGMGVRVYPIFEHADIDEDKNNLSEGNDILIGTASRLNEVFATAGFDVNQLKMYILDDLDDQLRSRLEPKLYRLSESIGKTQRVYFTKTEVEQMDMFIDKTMTEDVSFFDFYAEDEEEDEEDIEVEDNEVNDDENNETEA